MNPADLAMQKRKLEFQKLQEENEKLKQRLKLLEEAPDRQIEDLTVKVEQKILEQPQSKDVEGTSRRLNLYLY